ncbi:alpha-(1,3)-fucosyltransferase 7-like [Aricia agestis]|uniref:alpha-(1,3)-fucosyltransferase 7-like n=1 Tax=Aricia agestis TaxID=91739 RepID=UPI001C202E40|nr:alpha-(1,3)-fucosyltransferase 7-like [Aricia agestis]
MYFVRMLSKFVLHNFYRLLLIVLCLSVFLIYSFDNIKTFKIYTSDYLKLEKTYENVELYFEKRKSWNTSNLGTILFKNKNPPDLPKTDRVYKILVWKYWKWLQNRHVFNFDRNRTADPLRNCGVRNCLFSGDSEDIYTADAVVIHIQKGQFPNVTTRNLNQRWIFLSDESPTNAFSMAPARPKLKDLAGLFNWSMTFRSDSDVPVPYGRTIQRILPHTSQVPFWGQKRRDTFVTILISNCAVSRRIEYLKELEKHIEVDIYGKCSKDHKESCPGHFSADCKVMAEYIFYLVFENSECHEYLTEKGFYHAYSKGAIPIIMGPSVQECEALLPPNSFLHVDNYRSAADLANHIKSISEDESKILEYHAWRNDFEVVNEHGYFGSPSYHFCRVCEALNYNDKSIKIYDEEMLKTFLDPALSCR